MELTVDSVNWMMPIDLNYPSSENDDSTPTTVNTESEAAGLLTVPPVESDPSTPQGRNGDAVSKRQK